MSTLIAKAVLFASLRHQKQRRKYTDEPYFNHCAEVASIVAECGGSDAMICAAYLHDTVEDTDTTLDEVRAEFGSRVASLVEALTEPAHVGNRKARKALEAARLAEIDPDAQTIKLADLISNTGSIVERDPDFAKVYLAEKAAILDVMTSGDPALYARAKRILSTAQTDRN